MVAAIGLAVLGGFALAIVHAGRRAERRLAASAAVIAGRLDALSRELGTALERAQRAERLAGALGERAEWLEPAEIASRTARAAALLAGADASVVRARNAPGAPLLATVGLSEEIAHLDGLGWPPGGTRSVALDFHDADGRAGEFRSGLAVPIQPADGPPAFLAVYWREQRELDDRTIGDLEALADRALLLLARTVEHSLEDPPRDDELTGLAGRRAFHDALAREAARARLGARSVSLLLVDVDDFRRLNEHDGQLAGDAALVDLAGRLRESARDDDIGCRVGGDEFALILPGAGLVEAEQVFARLQASLKDPRAERAHRLSVSGGIAVLEDGDDPIVVVHRAEQALRRAKDVARGSAVVASANGRRPE